MTWKKLIDATNYDITRGTLLKFNGEYPFEKEVVMMFCEMPSELGQFGLMTITGAKAGIYPYFIFADDIVENHKIRDWLVDHWYDFSLNHRIEDVFIRENLNYHDVA